MDNIQKNYENIVKTIPKNVTLVAVSKTYPAADIQKVYNQGQRDFGENRVQELLQKQTDLPRDIRWHLIGHLQTNKVKMVLPVVHLIHSVDRLKLIRKIQTESKALSMQCAILLQIKIAEEDSKFGLNENDFQEILKLHSQGEFPNVDIKGLMGMATFSHDETQLKKEFHYLKKQFDQYSTQYGWTILSMGMSSDYRLAIEEGSSMVRIGSSIFGSRH